MWNALENREIIRDRTESMDSSFYQFWCSFSDRMLRDETRARRIDFCIDEWGEWWLFIIILDVRILSMKKRYCSRSKYVSRMVFETTDRFLIMMVLDPFYNKRISCLHRVWTLVKNVLIPADLWSLAGSLNAQFAPKLQRMLTSKWEIIVFFRLPYPLISSTGHVHDGICRNCPLSIELFK